MTYLALFLCSRFSVSIPYLFPYPYTACNASMAFASSSSDQQIAVDESKPKESSVPLRKQAAAPPTYLFILPLIPISVATYIASTRYSDFRHHGFDILFGATMGFVISWGSFRMYHMPIRCGAGWSWGPRGISKAFGIRFGSRGYAEDEQSGRRKDLEAGNSSRHTRLASSSQS